MTKKKYNIVPGTVKRWNVAFKAHGEHPDIGYRCIRDTPLYTCLQLVTSFMFESDLPNEYSGLKYTHGLKETNAKANVNAAEGISGLMEIASGKYYRDNNKENTKITV